MQYIHICFYIHIATHHYFHNPIAMPSREDLGHRKGPPAKRDSLIAERLLPDVQRKNGCAVASLRNRIKSPVSGYGYGMIWMDSDGY